MPNVSALVFDGSGDWAEATHATALNLYGTDLTVEFWLKEDSRDDDYVVAKGNHGAEYLPWMVRCEYGTLRCGWRASYTEYSITYAIPEGTGTWGHFAWTLDHAADTARLYKNGSLVAGPTAMGAAHTAPGGSPGDTLFPLTVGSSGDGSSHNGQWDGQLDELRLWTVRRSDAEVASYYDKQAAGTETGLRACYHFNENTGTAANDATANAHHLTLTGATWTTTAVPTLTDAGGGGAQDTPELYGRPAGLRGQLQMHQVLAQ